MAANPSIQLGTDGNWAIKEDNLLAYKKDGTRFFNKEFDFTRNTTATFVSKNGLIQQSATNIPRIDFKDDTTGHLLLEPQSTNLIPYSEDIGSNGFLAINSSIQSNVSVSPDGTLNADLLKENTANDTHFMFKDFNLSSGQTYSISVFAKKNGANRNLRLNDGGVGWSSGFTVNFDLTNGTADSGGVIQSYGNGWYRCSVVGTTNATTSRLLIYSVLNSNTTYQGDGASGVFLYGLQVENLPYATSYIPTSGSTTTRLAETCNNSGSLQDFNSEEGVLYAEISALSDDGTNRQISLSDSTYTNTVLLRYLDLSNQIQGVCRVGGVFKGSCSHTLTSSNDFIKVAYKYKNSDFALWVNGIEVATSTDSSSFTANTLLELAFDRGDNTQQLYGKCKDLRVYKTALSDRELEILTIQ